MEEAFNNTIDAFITTLKLYENLGRDLPDSIRLNRKARQVPADMRECFETINPKSQSRSGTAPYWFKATLPPPKNVRMSSEL